MNRQPRSRNIATSAGTWFALSSFACSNRHLRHLVPQSLDGPLLEERHDRCHKGEVGVGDTLRNLGLIAPDPLTIGAREDPLLAINGDGRIAAPELVERSLNGVLLLDGVTRI